MIETLKLSPRKFNKIKDFAQDEIMSKAQRPEESHTEYIARCWTEGFLRMLKSEGYNICIRKDEMELIF